MSSIFSPLPKSLRIGVIRGGPSSEYESSLRTGANTIDHLLETHKPVDIFISRDGKWHMQGIERSPERILKHVDVIFNAMHGEFGEDGKLQAILDQHYVPYTGSNKYSSAIATNKWMTKERAKAVGIKTPITFLVRVGESIANKAREIFSHIPHPLIVKPARGGTSLTTHKVNSYSELHERLDEILSKHEPAIVEEYIPGKEALCGVIDDFRGKGLYTLPTIEVINNKDAVSPGNFSKIEKDEMEKVAGLIHKNLDLSHYSQSSFVVSPRRGVYFLEVDTLPDLAKESHFHKSLEAVGSNQKEFIHHLLNLALR